MLINLVFDKDLRKLKAKLFKIGITEDEIKAWHMHTNLNKYFDSLKRTQKDLWIYEEINNRARLGIVTL